MRPGHRYSCRDVRSPSLQRRALFVGPVVWLIDARDAAPRPADIIQHSFGDFEADAYPMCAFGHLVGFGVERRFVGQGAVGQTSENKLVGMLYTKLSDLDYKKQRRTRARHVQPSMAGSMRVRRPSRPAIDPSQRTASPAVPALIGSGSPSAVQSSSAIVPVRVPRHHHAAPQYGPGDFRRSHSSIRLSRRWIEAIQVQFGRFRRDWRDWTLPTTFSRPVDFVPLSRVLIRLVACDGRRRSGSDSAGNDIGCGGQPSGSITAPSNLKSGPPL